VAWRRPAGVGDLRVVGSEVRRDETRREGNLRGRGKESIKGEACERRGRVKVDLWQTEAWVFGGRHVVDVAGF